LTYNSHVLRILSIVDSFLAGVARLVDFGGQVHFKKLNGRSAADADARAIYSDWLAVGNDLRGAARAVDKNQKS
jgi:hypothetical protein